MDSNTEKLLASPARSTRSTDSNAANWSPSGSPPDSPRYYQESLSPTQFPIKGMDYSDSDDDDIAAFYDEYYKPPPFKSAPKKAAASTTDFTIFDEFPSPPRNTRHGSASEQQKENKKPEDSGRNMIPDEELYDLGRYPNQSPPHLSKKWFPYPEHSAPPKPEYFDEFGQPMSEYAASDGGHSEPDTFSTGNQSPSRAHSPPFDLDLPQQAPRTPERYDAAKHSSSFPAVPWTESNVGTFERFNSYDSRSTSGSGSASGSGSTSVVPTYLHPAGTGTALATIPEEDELDHDLPFLSGPHNYDVWAHAVEAVVRPITLYGKHPVRPYIHDLLMAKEYMIVRRSISDEIMTRAAIELGVYWHDEWYNVHDLLIGTRYVVEQMYLEEYAASRAAAGELPDTTTTTTTPPPPPPPSAAAAAAIAAGEAGSIAAVEAAAIAAAIAAEAAHVAAAAYADHIAAAATAAADAAAAAAAAHTAATPAAAIESAPSLRKQNKKNNLKQPHAYPRVDVLKDLAALDSVVLPTLDVFLWRFVELRGRLSEAGYPDSLFVDFLLAGLKNYYDQAWLERLRRQAEEKGMGINVLISLVADRGERAARERVEEPEVPFVVPGVNDTGAGEV
ncbi:hypothetical protein B0T19DRAFT_439092 [Cercophora scortea]|uniref:Uncharacterized protein n=1 Tax=Cercophora scortea TaxID=314031 RepID=A0AAE0MH31_9PEZI|nr:hypothetical protein B0T19DRAFT_439092 [Cercophora scortea]